jgi:hypothetical protein
MKYRIVLEVYKTRAKVYTDWLPFELAIEQAHAMSMFAETVWNNEWEQRSRLSHMDKYFDLYEEGFIKLESHHEFISEQLRKLVLRHQHIQDFLSLGKDLPVEISKHFVTFPLSPEVMGGNTQPKIDPDDIGELPK